MSDSSGSTPQADLTLEQCCIELPGKGPYWALLLIPSHRLIAYREALQNGPIVLSDYGSCVACGPGDEPPKDLLQEIYQTKLVTREELIGQAHERLDTALLNDMPITEY